MNIYDKVVSDDRLKVKIILPNRSGNTPIDTSGSVIVGYLENPFSFSNDAMWNDQLFGRDYASKLNEWLGKLGGDIQVMNVMDTTQQWTGASIPTFNLSFYLISTSVNSKPTEVVKKLYQAIYPEKNGATTVKFHWGYKPNQLGEAGINAGAGVQKPTSGTVILTIGTWFRAINLLIKSFTPTYSPTLNPQGQPYWVKLDIQFTFRRLPYYDEMQSIFISNPN